MKMKRYPFLWLLFPVLMIGLVTPAGSTIHERQPDMRSMGTGGNGVTQSVLVNPALLPLADKRTFFFQYHNAYGLRELGTLSGGFQYPNAWLPIGIQFATFGYDAYRKTMFRLALGKQLGEQWAVGVGIQYTVLQTALYDEQPARLSTDIGVVFTPSDRWRIGLTALHIPSVSIVDKQIDSGYLTPFSVQVGIGWQLIDPMTLLCSIVADKESIRGEAGIEYTLFDACYLRAGVHTDPLLPCFGIGYTYSHFTVDVSAISHPVLGMQTGIGLTFSF